MSMSTDFEERVRLEAYRLWEESGRPHGRDAEFWDQACALVSKQAASSARPAEPAKAAASPRKARKKAAEPEAKPASEPPPPRRKSKKPGDQPANSSAS